MPPDTLAVQWIAIDRLFCSPANPRHNDEAVPHVEVSIRRFGWRQPVVAKLLPSYLIQDSIDVFGLPRPGELPAQPDPPRA